ncbi:FAD/NAD(P)-binding oxidoreductase [Curtobacterium sp. MCBD17_003]|uniref:NAD(P)/FAD-dependent oxidoreductase n=1 Tax=Curtobacterium sp. MCBD17_003 TaxID=2175667 RepID=UPI000DA99F17|nr:FAD/NAD(P)-binding oxidoreductase [Curtobacterium sp. MCBD17_003]WIE54980.1 FAD/NAD(P)-binding oxidoreductase [Curtobacterium sp. MCBD17_003]
MTDHRYLVIGGGMVADAAAKGIREIDEQGSIGILSTDVDTPYARPALSKKLWTDPDFSWDKVDLHTADATGAEIHLRTTVVAIDRTAKSVTTDDGQRFGYERLLIATGGTPTPLPIEHDDRVIDYRSAEDYRRLRGFADQHAHVIVVGGSYIGTELAAALVQNGATVTLVHPDDVLGGSMFPADLAAAFERRYRDAGVDLVGGRKVTDGRGTDDGVIVTLDDGRELRADAVVSGLGITPNVDLARDAGLPVDDGVVVSATLVTEDPDVFAAGDVAEYPDLVLGRRRVEHVDNAQEQGRQAGRNLAGADEPYTHTPYYYSNVFDIGYEAVGRVQATLRTVEEWAAPLEQGVVYYLDGDVTRGVLLWNVQGQRDAARQVLAEAEALTPDMLPGRIPTGG